jgi:outer membrane protein W
VKYGRYKVLGEANLTSGRLETLIAEGNNLMNNLYFNYTFPKGMFRPVFLAGFSYSIFTNISEINVIDHITYNDDIILVNDYADVIQSSYMGLVIGAGLDIPVLKKHSIVTTVQYNFMKDTGEISCYSYNPFSIIIGFKL